MKKKIKKNEKSVKNKKMTKKRQNCTVVTN
jgi:hypothetical protein